jgi:hypothetical protein
LEFKFEIQNKRERKQKKKEIQKKKEKEFNWLTVLNSAHHPSLRIGPFPHPRALLLFKSLPCRPMIDSHPTSSLLAHSGSAGAAMRA